MRKLFTLCMSLAVVTGCSSVTVDNYRDNRPELRPDAFFTGYLTAHGVVKNRAGRVIRTFNADIDASWEEGVGTLVEDFIFDDGENQQRIWTLSPDGQGGYIGTAGDVIGGGVMGLAGNSAFLDYVLRVPYGESTVDVRVDDRMYLVSPDVLVNESVLTKFGVRVGSLLLVILRQDGERAVTVSE
ncbi:MAG: DUF3833 domain-containing protein [Halioglobus sp.]